MGGAAFFGTVYIVLNMVGNCSWTTCANNGFHHVVQFGLTNSVFCLVQLLS